MLLPDTKRGPDTGQEDKAGRSVLVEDQPSFVDEEPRTGKQFTGGGRKVADLERVGAMSPDADPDQDESRPNKPQP